MCLALPQFFVIGLSSHFHTKRWWETKVFGEQKLAVVTVAFSLPTVGERGLFSFFTQELVCGLHHSFWDKTIKLAITFTARF